MNFEELIEWQEQLQRNLDGVLKNVSKWLNADMFTTIEESIKALDNFWEAYRQVPYQQMIENAKNTILHLQTEAFQSSLSQITNICNSLEQIASYSAVTSPVDVLIPSDLLSRISNVLLETEPYIKEDIQEECVEILPDEEPAAQGFSLNLKRALSLLNFLLALFSLIVQLLPNSQLEEIAEQNEQLIASQEEQLELERKQAATLEEIAQNLSEVIVDLNKQIELQRQQIESFGEQSNDFDNLSDSADQNANADGQQQNDNPED